MDKLPLYERIFKKKEYGPCNILLKMHIDCMKQFKKDIMKEISNNDFDSLKFCDHYKEEWNRCKNHN